MTRKSPKHEPSELRQAHSYLEKVIEKLGKLDSRQKEPLIGVLKYISDYIASTRSEICALRPAKDGVTLSASSGELEEVIQETASAASSIMSAAEAIEAIAARLPPPASEELIAAVTRIYEASAFQDITGQRITKVLRAIESVEKRIDALMRFCAGPAQPEGCCGGRKHADDDKLLNCPQRSQKANSQSDIDRLLA